MVARWTRFAAIWQVRGGDEQPEAAVARLTSCRSSARQVLDAVSISDQLGGSVRTLG